MQFLIYIRNQNSFITINEDKRILKCLLEFISIEKLKYFLINLVIFIVIN